MSIGDIKPQVGEDSTSSTTQSMKPNVDEEEDKEVPPIHPRVQVPSTQVQDQVNPTVQSSSQVQDNHAQPPQAPQDVLQVRHGRIFKNHPINQIIGSPSKGVSTHYKQQASFVEHYSFVSFVEPICVEEALKNPN
jgi:23S rRNA maturation-related 3'-5' exoribonuclease YhaM